MSATHPTTARPRSSSWLRALGVPVVFVLHACGSTPAPVPAPGGTGVASADRTASDPQSTYEPRSDPGAGQRFLQRMVGDFDVTKEFHGRDGGTSTSRGECHQQMVQDGRFLESRFVFHGDQGDSTGLGLIGFDTRAGSFTSVWIDSRSTRMSLRQSEVPATADELVLHSRSLEASGGRRSRTITRIEAGGARILHRQYSPNTDGGERLVMELVLTRKASS
ncbi:MAG: DUF1579 family protein [Planctomycetota bacterium]